MRTLLCRSLLLTLLFLLSGLHSRAQTGAFITEWVTNNSSIVILTKGSGYNYTVAWTNLTHPGVKEGSLTAQSGNATLGNLENGSTYRVAITGSFPRFFMNNVYAQKSKLRNITQWGAQVWQTMDSAFRGCEQVVCTATDAPNLSQVHGMNAMFDECERFTGNLSAWNVSQVEDMAYLFHRARRFNSDLSGWNVSNVKNMSNLFAGASAFRGNVSSWNVGQVKDMSRLFYGNASFNDDIGGWNVANVTNMNSMFFGCAAFNRDLNSWNVSKVTDMSYLFGTAVQFNGNISSWNVGNVTDMSSMFYYALKFDGNIGSWNVSKVTNMSEMFLQTGIFNGNIGGWNVGQVTSMSYMFAWASAFNGDISGWNVSNVTDMSGMFYNAAVFNRNLGGWNVGKVINMYNMFSEAPVFTSDLSNWNVGQVTSMYGMFSDAPAFNSDLSRWNVGNVTEMGRMFCRAYQFNSDLSRWNVAKVVTMNQMFDQALSFNGSVDGWKVDSVIEMTNMFYFAQAFNQSLGSWRLNPAVNISNLLGYNGMGCAAYSNTLLRWAASVNTPPGLSLGAFGREYGTHAVAARNALIARGWTFDGDAAGSSICYHPDDAFITDWVTTNGEIILPGSGTGFDYSVSWRNLTNPGTGEGAVSGLTSAGYTITGLQNGSVYRVAITGSFPHFIINNGTERLKLRSIIRWGTQSWRSMENAFYGCTNMSDSARDFPILNQAVSTRRMFQNCPLYNGDVTIWNVGNLDNMAGMFSGATSFDRSLSRWKLKNAVNLNTMLDNCGMSCVNYTSTLIGWASRLTTPSNFTLGATGRLYGTNAVAARSALISSGWTINSDNGTGTVCPVPLHYRTAGNTDFVSATNWQISLDSSGWTLASLPPDGTVANTLSVTVRAGHTATVGAPTTLFVPLRTDSASFLALNAALSLRSHLVHNGRASGTGRVILAGTATQAIGGKGILQELTLSNEAGALMVAPENEELSITSAYSATAGTLITNGHLRFVSNATATARHASGLIEGDVTVERYLPARTKGATEAYKSLFLSSPVIASVNRSGWQRQIHITGGTALGTPPAGDCVTVPDYDFDLTQTGNSGLYTYNDGLATGKWVAFPYAYASLLPSEGYRVVVRGPRSLGCALIDGSAQTTVAAVTLAPKGQLNQGDIDLLPANGLFQLAGNPFASSINFDLVKADAGTTIEPGFWTYHPVNAAGVYSVYNSGSMTNRPAGYHSVNIIAQGQAFFVRRTAGNLALLPAFFREAHKTATAQPGMFRTISGGDNQYGWQKMVRLSLHKGIVVADSTRMDETLVRFSAANPQVSTTVAGSLDALQMSAATTTISSGKAGQWLSIQTRPVHTLAADTVAVRLTAAQPGQYGLNIAEQVEMAGTDVFLRDKFLGTQQPIVADQPVAIDITGNPASQGTDRFELIFRPAATLAAKFVAVSGERAAGSGKATVKFTAQEDGNVKTFAVERSADGSRFEPVVSLKGSDRAGQFSYVAEDGSVSSTVIYYRIKANNAGGTVDYSSIIKLSNHQIITLALSPNPAKDVVTLKAEGLSGKATVRFTDANGRVVLSQPLTISGNGTQQLSVTSLAQGIYQMQIVSEAGETLSTQKLIKL